MSTTVTFYRFKPTSGAHRSLTLFGGALLLSTIAAVGCADLDGLEGEDGFTEKSFGDSASVYYSCATSTISPDGAKWSYQSDEVMNLMSEIKVHVTRDTDDFGKVALSRVDTDTFSDGNLTLRLVQMGAQKSIEVEHSRVGLVARAENGWCSSETRGGATGGGSSGGTQFSLKVNDRCESPCSFSLKTDMPVAWVEYKADQWSLGESHDSSAEFSSSYSFNTPGLRTLSVTGYDQNGNELSTDSRQIEVVGPQASAGRPLSVPYYYQYNNQYSPGASCQNTSAAMLLNFLGASVSPDDITARYGKDRAQSVSGLNDVFNRYADSYGVRRLRSTSQGSFAELHAALESGSPVIVHGYFTSAGHVVVVTGYDGNGYYVNDPAGVWDQRFMGSYPGAWSQPSAGRNVYYPKAAFETAIGTTNGRSAVPLWMHSL